MTCLLCRVTFRLEEGEQVNADQLAVYSPAANIPVVVDAVLANMEAGLQYVYFNLLSTQPALRRLEQQLAAETLEHLIVVPMSAARIG